MIRSSVVACLLVSLVAAQGPVDTRLGLLAPGLGVAPVPGASNPNQGQRPPPAHIREDRCICIQVNQLCNPRDIPPLSQTGGQNRAPNLGSSVINIRIVNNRPSTNPCDKNEQLCCPGGSFPSPVPPSVLTNPALSGCGTRSPTPYAPSKPAVADFGEYPWMALVLSLNDEYIGGGALVSPVWVLTAAHKVHNQHNIKVRLGEHDVTKKQDHPQYAHVDVTVTRIVVHPNFNSKTLQNDVALLQLSRPVALNNFPHINTACLPEAHQLFTGQRCYVTGFGQDAFQGGRFQNILKEVDVTIIDPFRCQTLLRQTRLGETFTLDRESFICAGGEPGKDACTGDGGSPLVCGANGRWTIAGLVAWGIDCATQDVPGVYVNVASFRNFIQQYVR